MAQGKLGKRQKTAKKKAQPNKKARVQEKKRANRGKGHKKASSKTKQINQHIENLMLARAKDASTAEGVDEARRNMKLVSEGRDLLVEIREQKRKGQGPLLQTRKKRKQKDKLKQRVLTGYELG